MKGDILAIIFGLAFGVCLAIAAVATWHVVPWWVALPVTIMVGTGLVIGVLGGFDD